jgi:dipeptidyl aminopeptidase/acylaminoacyl peptidase
MRGFWNIIPKAKLILAACHLYILVAPIVTESQQLAPLPIEEALSVRSFGQLVPIQFSPDGKWLAYTVQENQRSRSVGLEDFQRTGVPPWAMGTDIWLSNTQSDEAKNLTGGMGNNWLPVWSPNGRYLAFLSDRDGGGQGHARLWIWDSTTENLRRVASTEVRAEHIAWMPDSRALVVTSVPEGLSTEKYVQKTSIPNQEDASVVAKASSATVVLYHSGTARSEDRKISTSDPWSLDRYLRDLLLVDIDGGKERTLVHLKRVAEFHLSPDGSRLAYTVPKRFEKPGSQQTLFDLVIIDLASTQDHTVASDIRLDFEGAAFSWSLDGTQLSFRLGGVEEKRQDCYVLDVAKGTSRNVSNLLSIELPRHYKSLSPPLWHPNGKYIFYVREGALWRSSIEGNRGEKVAEVPNRRIVQVIPKSENLLWETDGKSAVVVTHDDVGKQDGFYRIDFGTGTTTQLLERGECYTCVNVTNTQLTAVTGNGERVAYYAEDAQHDAALWFSDALFKTKHRVTHFNPQFERVRMAPARLVNWVGTEGEALQGTLLLPSDFQVGKRYPLVVWVYRGASLSDRYDQFALGYSGPFNAQLLATRGYAVFAPDVPQHLGTAMADIAKSVLPGMDRLVEMGVVDPNRIGVMGHSFGGYSVLALIVQTKRFRAAIELDGFGDLISGYGEMTKEGTAFLTSVLESQEMMGGSPWQFRDRYIDNSPIYYLDRVETPLLIVHGTEDTTVAPFLGDQIFVGLRRLGKEVEYAKYKGEGHSPLYWSYANQADLSLRIIDWFDEHLKLKISQ